MLPTKPIAAGRTAEVYAWYPGAAWKPDQVLKLYFAKFPSNWVDYEARIAHAVDQAGMPAPKPGEVIEIDGRRGILYERIEGPAMLDVLAARLHKLLAYGRTMASLHLEMHQATLSCLSEQGLSEQGLSEKSLSEQGLPKQTERLAGFIRHAPDLPDSLREPIIADLDALPDGDRLCHGDFHPGNIILTARGPLVIDWVTASVGHPAADVARTRLLLTMSDPPPDPILRLLVLFARGLFNNAYLGEYRRHSPEVVRLSDDFLPVIAAARLDENIAPEREKLLKFIMKRWRYP